MQSVSIVYEQVCAVCLQHLFVFENIMANSFPDSAMMMESCRWGT
jgi:hypothetical protein